MAGDGHVGARDVEGEALRVVELAMLGGRDVRDAGDLARPVDRVGIHRAGDGEATAAPATRRLDEEALERGLAIDRVGAEIAEVPTRLHRQRLVQLGIDGAVERPWPRAVT